MGRIYDLIVASPEASAIHRGCVDHVLGVEVLPARKMTIASGKKRQAFTPITHSIA